MRASTQPDACAYVFLQDGETEQARWTYRELDARARAVAARLQGIAASGDRVVLLYPPGLDFIAGFFGCLYAGMVAVPACPPRPNRSLRAVDAIVADARAAVALSTSPLLAELERRVADDPLMAAVRWVATDAIALELAQAWREPSLDGRSLAFLQYTSGSTGNPKGVMVTHDNLLCCEQMIERAFEHTDRVVGLGWLPVYHDMGLIGNVLQVAYLGVANILMPPVAFLQKPLRWLQAISRYRATTSGGPNSAYELCVRKIAPHERAGLDLSSWDVAFVGAEPIHRATLDRFCEAFGPCGFRREAFYPCYGMAEATLMISGGLKAAPPVFKKRPTVDSGTVLIHHGNGNGEARTLVGCGNVLPGEQVVIVDPETLSPCKDGQVGEIWVAGPNVTQGYWNRPEETDRTFRAHLDNGDGPLLRTGDLGLLEDGELFLTGRLKNVIIIRGRNYYPQDIEASLQESHAALRAGCGAAFSVELDDREQLVVVHEVERDCLRNLNVDEVIGAVRQAIAEQHDLEADAVLLLKTSTIPKTSSGKVRHHACRTAFLDGSLQVVGEWRRSSTPVEAAAQHSPSVAPLRLAAAEALEAWLVAVLARRLGVPPETIDVRQPFARYGLDSVSAVSLAEALEAHLGRPLAPTLAYDYPSIQSLARHLAEEAAEAAPAVSAVRDERRGDADAIAVVGLGCRFPGAEDPAAFWQLLVNGVDAVTEVPPDRWDADAFFDADPAAPGKMTTRRGGFLARVDQFDPRFFGISPREAESMDPQQRLALEVTWEALEHAGIAPDRLAGSATGVFLGISSGDYLRLQLAHPDGLNAYTGSGNAPSLAAGRLSYLLDLRGPSWAVDTACSSSLVAVHQACQSLRQGECDLALAGGVNLILLPHLSVAFSQAGLLSADGRCRVFDSAADGYVRSEGCGIVVLKRLADALSDGDTVLALVRGSAVNQSGRSNGLAAPNGPAQQAVFRQALQAAKMAPAQIGFVEAHSTGTLLGDPIEWNSLQEVLREGRPCGQPCWVGSVKTNLGHLEAAAGVAALIKVVLSLEHEAIPRHLHLSKPNPQIALTLDRGPLAIPTAHRAWPRGPQRRAAGVSAAGFGGTNACIIVEEAPPPAAPSEVAQLPADRPLHLFTLSAKNETALRELAGHYAAFLGGRGDLPLADVCFTANTGRCHFAHRLAATVQSVEELCGRLAKFAAGGEDPGLAAAESQPWKSPPIAFLFSGQESAYAGMARRLYDAQPTLRRIVGRCRESLPDAQPPLLHSDLFALECALAELWMSWGIRPAMLLGHGLGEYAAACVAGVFAFDDGLKLVARHDRWMRASGRPEESDARKQYEQCCREVTFRKPSIPILSAGLGRSVSEEVAAAEYWCNYAWRPPQIARALSATEAQGADIFLEIGPEPLLSAAGRRCEPTDNRLWLASLGKGRDDWQQLLGTLAQLYLRGAPVDWHGFDRDYARRKVVLPTYPFQRQRCWLEPPATGASPAPPPSVAFPRAKSRSNGHAIVQPQADRLAGRISSPSEPVPLAEWPADLGGLSCQPISRRAPQAGELEICVHAVGLDVKDILSALGGCRAESLPGGACAGEVVALGEGVEAFEIGDRVVAVVPAGLAPHVTVRSELAALRPGRLSAAEAAATPAAFLAASYALEHLTSLRPAQHVWIHAAAEAAGLAAVQLAQRAGAQVLASAMPDQWALLKSHGVKHLLDARTPDLAQTVLAATAGQGVDVVLSCAPGGPPAAHLSALAAGGRWIEVGPVDPRAAAEAASARPDVSVSSVSLPRLIEQEPALVQHILTCLMEQLEDASLQPAPHTVLTLQEAIAALGSSGLASRAGTIVVTLLQNGHASSKLFASGAGGAFSVAAYIEHQIREVLRLDGARIDLNQPLSQMGLDSLTALELRNRVVTDLGADVPLVKFLEGISVAGLAALLAGQFHADSSRPAAVRTDWVEGEI